MAKIVRPFNTDIPFKLEVGSGANPQPGYIHCDINEPNPELDIVCHMGREDLPIPDGCVSELLSNHSCEHVPWVSMDTLFMDWHRVIMPGGRLFLRTPDLEFICRTYLDGKTIREHPVDEANMVRITGDVGPCQWAIIKLFAGQNYSGNVHYYCLDFPTLKVVLERIGFERVQRLHDQPVFSPGEICAVAFKKK